MSSSNNGTRSGASSSHPQGSSTNLKAAASSAKSTAPKRSKAVSSASSSETTATLQRRPQVDKAIVDELLLIFGVIGSEDPVTGEFVPVHDCLQWLQDLQRAVRRDDDLLRPICLFLGQWKLLQQKLLPLLLYSGRYDRPLLLTLCKILVILTKPMADNTVRAGKMVIDPKGASEKKNVDPALYDKFIQEQIWLRENSIQQANLLVEYKKAFCNVHHQKMHRGNSNSVFSVLVSMLAEPLAKSGRRTDQDHMVIELVLHLFCNLLQAQPLFSSSAEEHVQVHDELVHWMHQELVLDILCVLSADLENRDTAPYNLLVMELLHHLWKPYHPAAVAHAISGASHSVSAVSKNKGELLGQLQREKASYSVQAHSRHGHFGGTLQIQKKHAPAGANTKKYVSASQFALEHAAGQNFGNNAIDLKRKHKRSDVFVPGGGVGGSQRRHGPSAQRATRALNEFLERFCCECYASIAKSLKGEFRRDSTKLQDGDKVLFLKVIWFVSHWWRLSKSSSSSRKSQTKINTEANTVIGSLIFTMDIFTFDMVLRAIDNFQQLKQYSELGLAVAVLSEMLHLLFMLYQSKEPTEHIMALGLLDRLYYNAEPLDRLPQLMSKWEPGTTSREYLADLVEVCHTQLKILEANEAAINNTSTNADAKKTDKTVMQMREMARDFDLQSYIRKRLVSVHTVYLYIQLLGQFEHNSVTTNHRIVAFLKNRLSKQVIFRPEEDEQDAGGRNSLPNPKVTLQPLLYQFSFLRILDRILNSATLSTEQKKHLVPWATSVVYEFQDLAQRNPFVWVEALLAPSHIVTRHCEQLEHVYVQPEFYMLLIKDQLQRQVTANQDSNERDTYSERDEEEMELEFSDAPAGKPTAVAKRRSIDDGSDGESTENKKAEKPNDNAPTCKRRIIDDESDEESTASGKVDKAKGEAPALKRRVVDDDHQLTTNDETGTAKSDTPASKRHKIVLSDSASSSDEETENDIRITEIPKVNAFANKSDIFSPSREPLSSEISKDDHDSQEMNADNEVTKTGEGTNHSSSDPVHPKLLGAKEQFEDISTKGCRRITISPAAAVAKQNV